MADLDALFSEIQSALRRYQPRLCAALLPHAVVVSGPFVCTSDEGAFDTFDIEMSVSALFPQKEPDLKEVAGRIPHSVARHVFPSSGRCCLGLWEGWLLKTDVADFESYLCGPVTSYFVSQSVFEITGEWPFGEQGHETEDIAATYAEALGLKDGADHRGLLRLLTAPFLSGNPLCPCGSRKRLRDCHWKWLRERRRRIHASVRNEMARRLLKAAKE